MAAYLWAILVVIVPCIAPQTIQQSTDDSKCNAGVFCTNPRINLPYVNRTWSNKGCSDTGCYGVPYEDLTVIYSGLFNTQKQHRQLFAQRQASNSAKPAPAPSSADSKSVYYDGKGSCCPRKVHYKIIYHMENWDGIRKALVQIEVLGRYQFVPHLECSSPVSPHCLGNCIPRSTLMYFLVWVQNQSQFFWEFDIFEVPTYCSFRMR